MKKLFLTTGLMFVFMGLAQAELAAPKLLNPDNGANLPLKKVAKFTWQKVTGASKYRLIFSNDKSFANYDANKFKCLNAKTCFLYTVASPSYNVLASHVMLKKDGNYFWQVQTVGKKIADNSKMSEIRSFSVGIPTPPAIDSISVVPKGDISIGNHVQIRVTLEKPFSDNAYSLQISVNGEDFQPMTQAKNPINFSFNYTPSIGEQQFVIKIFDENDEIVDSNSGSFLVIDAEATTQSEDYTKIANNGSELPDDAQLGTAPTDWACTKDNKTGLIWEVKTDDGGLRDRYNKYTNYTKDYPKDKFGDSTNTDGFVNAVNKQGLCGAKDWRMPTRNELTQLVSCSDGKYNKLTEDTLNSKGYGFVCAGNENNLTTTSPTINATYFPDTKDNYWFWSSSPDINDSSNAWNVSFASGFLGYYGSKDSDVSVRLVR